MISLTSKGGFFEKTMKSLKRLASSEVFGDFNKYGREGCIALEKATPRESGLTAGSWEYRIIREGKRVRIEWYNTNVENGHLVAIGIQYGHGLRDGSYIQGRDYVNPAMRPVFDRILSEMKREVTA